MIWLLLFWVRSKTRPGAYSVLLGKGDTFGEIMRENKLMGKSCATVRALTYCDLHKIHAEDIIEILEMYPEYARGFWSNLDLTFDLREVWSFSVLQKSDIFQDNDDDIEPFGTGEETLLRRRTICQDEVIDMGESDGKLRWLKSKIYVFSRGFWCNWRRRIPLIQIEEKLTGSWWRTIHRVVTSGQYKTTEFGAAYEESREKAR